MKPKYILFILCISLLGYSCITKYEAKGIDKVGDILVVDGIITDDETIIMLSRSVNLTDEDFGYYYFVDNAEVYVECDDGTRWQAEPYYDYWISRNGRYIIKTGKLNLACQYRLKIEIGELEYSSDYSHPIETPEIDSIFYVKRGKGQPIMMYVDTHSPKNENLYYRWSYREDWEVNAEVYVNGYPYNCWNSSRSMDVLLGSGEKTVYGQLADILTEISPSDRRLSALYRIIVKQNSISKRSHDYYANIKKNSQQSGSIFAPVPSELRGNITCTTDPEKPVIGYVDVSTTTKKQRLISRADMLFENPLRCMILDREYVLAMNGGRIPDNYVPYGSGSYVERICVDCTLLGGFLQKPDEWPPDN